MNTPEILRVLRKHRAVLGRADFAAALQALGVDPEPGELEGPLAPLDPIDAALYAVGIMGTAHNRQHLALLRGALMFPWSIAAGEHAAQSLSPFPPKE